MKAICQNLSTLSKYHKFALLQQPHWIIIKIDDILPKDKTKQGLVCKLVLGSHQCYIVLGWQEPTIPQKHSVHGNRWLKRTKTLRCLPNNLVEFCPCMGALTRVTTNDILQENYIHTLLWHILTIDGTEVY